MQGGSGVIYIDTFEAIRVQEMCAGGESRRSSRLEGCNRWDHACDAGIKLQKARLRRLA
jgi:hypothetical protein